MNREIQTQGAGRMILACLLGIVLAMAAPLAMLAEIFSLSIVLMLPAIGLIWLYRWGGRGPAMLSAVLQMVLTSQMLSGSFMWVVFFSSIVPVFVLAPMEKKPFFDQMKISISAFGAGIVISVAILYLNFGGNMIERLLVHLPEAMRALPLDALTVPMQQFGEIAGQELTPESFYQMFENAINGLIPAYQLNLPGQIFSGGLISAVACAWISAFMLKRRGLVTKESYVPVREWSLPGSATGGLLLITAISYIAYAAGMQNGKTLYFTVYNITVTAFCIQAITSIVRKASHPKANTKSRTGIIFGMILLWLLGGSLSVAIYGCASAIFGSRGALIAHRKNVSDNHHSNDDIE